MMDKEIRILIVEDSSTDAELEGYELRKAGLVFTSKIVDTRETFLKELNDFSPDIILSDYDLPTFDGLAALRIAKEKCPDVPFIIVSGKLGEEFAIEKLREGATDYVLKGNLKRLVPVISRAIEEAKMNAERKKSKELLLSSEKTFRSIVESLPVGMFIYELHDDGRLIFMNANPAADKILGVDCSQFIGKTIEEVFPPLAKTEIPEMYRRVASTGIPWNTEEISYEHGKIEGAYEVNAFQLSSNNVGVLFSDITERKRAEEALIKEKEFTEITLDSQVDTFFVFEPTTGRAIRWNKAFKDVSGYTNEEIASLQAPNSYYSPKDLEKAIHLLDAIKRDEKGRIELSLICKDGHKIITEYETSIVPGKHGEPDYIIAIGRDITERKRVEEQVKKLNESMGLAMEVSKAGAWDWDIINNVFLWSPEFLKLFGMTPDTLAGFEAWSNCLHPDDREIAAKRIQESINNKTELSNDYRIILPNQEIRWIRGIGKTFYDKDTPQRMTGICIDITEHKRLEGEVRDKIRSLESLNKRFIGKEQRMIELTKEVNSLLEQLGQPNKYTR